MKKTVVKTTLDLPVDAVWNVIGAVGGVDTWSPVITSCEIRSSPGGGLERICGSDQGTLKEKILKMDHEQRILSYSIYEQPFLPVTDLVSTIEVTGNAESTLITTTSVYELNKGAEASEVEAVLQQIYNGSYMGIREVVSAQA